MGQLLQGGGVAATARFGQGKILWRTSLTSHHLWAAENFARMAKQLEEAHTGRPRFNVEHRSYVVASLMSATGFMEAAVNEFLLNVRDEHAPLGAAPISSIGVEFLKHFWKDDIDRFGPLDKYDAALLLCGRPKLDRGRAPAQDVELAVDLRNRLVHFKPKHHDSTATPEKKSLEARLAQKKLRSNPFVGPKNPFFPDRCLSATCADWATRSCRALADEFFASLGIVPAYQTVKF